MNFCNDNPSPLLLGIMPFVLGTQMYGYGNVFGGYMQQQNQCANVANTLDTRIQQCCCNVSREMEAASRDLAIQNMNARIADLQFQNYMSQINVPRISFSQVHEKKKLTMKEFDKLLFPVNPIRDYIEKVVEEIERKYNDRVRLIDMLEV